MATHNSLFSEHDVRTGADGDVLIDVQIPWYRSLWLSCVSDVEVNINGAPVPKEQLRWDLAGRSYSIGELADQWGTLWFLADKATVVVPGSFVEAAPAAPGAAGTLEVELVLTLRLLYMQIAPQRYVTNRVAVKREVLAA